MGVEFEYAGQNQAADNSNIDTFIWLLEPVQLFFGGSKPVISPWNKYKESQNTFYASFIDHQGRKWSAVPEIMNTEGFDGYELITPPLTSEEDILNTEKVLKLIEDTGLFIRGKSSSSHFTADVSDLIGPNDNISKIVDLILFLENHTLEIYNLIKPVRYGKAMNTYAVPLSLNQKELLYKLAALPYHERTYNRVRDIFVSYSKKELLLVENEMDHVWKFRLFNYGKFFAIGNFKKRINVIESRMADLATSANFRRLGDIYTTLIEVGSSQPVYKFTNPFNNIENLGVRKIDHTNMDNYIRSLPYEKYRLFLEKLNFNPIQFPPYKTSSPFPLYSLSCRNVFVN
jgi:hypothetical protein